jgi:YD repeat-containing protein
MGRITTFSYTTNLDGTLSTLITDPAGHVTLDQYAFGELVSETKGHGTPSAATWQYSYDPVSLGVTSVTDPNGHTTAKTYDSGGNLLTVTDPLNRTTVSTYDSLNDRTSEKDPLGVTTSYTYDASGNLLTRSRPLDSSHTQTTTSHYADTAHPGDVTSMTEGLPSTMVRSVLPSVMDRHRR